MPLPRLSSSVALGSGPFPGCGCLGALAGGGRGGGGRSFLGRATVPATQIVVLCGAPRSGSPRGGGLAGRRAGNAVAASDARLALPPSTAACLRPVSVWRYYTGEGGTGWASVVQSRPQRWAVQTFQACRARGQWWGEGGGGRAGHGGRGAAFGGLATRGGGGGGGRQKARP